jgi:hypothetical protein
MLPRWFEFLFSRSREDGTRANARDDNADMVIIVGSSLHGRVKFYLLLLFGVCIFLPFIYMSILAQLYVGIALFSAFFLFYSYLVYAATYLRLKRKYPMVPPEGRPDIYFPRTNIPRPIYEDAQRHPRFFKKKRQKKSAR